MASLWLAVEYCWWSVDMRMYCAASSRGHAPSPGVEGMAEVPPPHSPRASCAIRRLLAGRGGAAGAAADRRAAPGLAGTPWPPLDQQHRHNRGPPLTRRQAAASLGYVPPRTRSSALQPVIALAPPPTAIRSCTMP